MNLKICPPFVPAQGEVIIAKAQVKHHLVFLQGKTIAKKYTHGWEKGIVRSQVKRGKPGEIGFFRVEHKRSATFKASLCNYELSMGEYGHNGHMAWVVIGPGGGAAPAAASAKPKAKAKAKDKAKK